MGGNEGTVDPRVEVLVSPPMGKLRKMQTILNHFLWSTELCYGDMLDGSRSAFPEPTQLVSEALGHVSSEAWYLNNQGRGKYIREIDEFLEDVREGLPHVCRAVIVYFFAAFEDYLDNRVLQLKPKKNNKTGSWRPYVSALSHDILVEPPSPLCPLRLSTVICADLCGMIRNRIVHPPFDVPRNIKEEKVKHWKRSLLGEARKRSWSDGPHEQVVAKAVNRVIGEADDEVKKAERDGKTLPIELFYAIFTFSNLDSLAFEIEEALFVPGSTSVDRVTRKDEYVRRRDLIIGHVT